MHAIQLIFRLTPPLFNNLFYSHLIRQQQLLGEEFDDDDEPEPPPTSDEKNPLYSNYDYVADFSNPIYRPTVTKKMTKEGIAIIGSEKVAVEDTIPLSEHDISRMDESQEIEMAEADTLF